MEKIKENQKMIPFIEFNSYSPIFEFYTNYKMYTPRKITNIEWAILSAVYYLKPNDSYKNMLLKDIFEHIYSIPLSEQLVYNELIKLYHTQGLITCRDSAIWETIYLEDLELTDLGQEAFKLNKISTTPQEKIESYLFDPLEQVLVPNGAKGNCVESIPKNKELLALKNSDEISFVFPEGLVRTALEKKIQLGSDTEISGITENTVKGEAGLLWNQLKVNSFVTVDGEIEIEMQKKQYTQYVTDTVMRAPYEILDIRDDVSVPGKKINDEQYPVNKILFSPEQKNSSTEELFKNIKGKKIIQYVSEEHFQIYEKQYQNIKGVLIVFASELAVTHEKERLIVHIPKIWFANNINFINNIGSNQFQGRFELKLERTLIYAVLTYQLGREKEQLFNELHEILAEKLNANLNKSNQLNISCILAAVFEDANKGWDILRKSVRHLPVINRLKMYKNFLNFVSEMKIKNVSSANEIIFNELLEESKLEEDTFVFWKEVLEQYPLGKATSDANWARKVIETIEFPSIQSYKELQEVIIKMKELPIHIPTIVRESYRQLYTEKIAVEHLNEVQALQNEGVYFDKDVLTEAWKTVIHAKKFFNRHMQNSAVNFCKEYVYEELIGVLRTRIREWYKAYEQLSKLFTEHQLDEHEILSLTEFSLSHAYILKLDEWIKPLNKTITEKNTGRFLVVDYLVILENPKIIEKLILKNTVLLYRDLSMQMENYVYSLREEADLEEKLLIAKETVAKFQAQTPKRIVWADAKVELLPRAECMMGIEQSIALQYVKLKPSIITANEHLYTPQGKNGAEFITVENILAQAASKTENKQQESKKKRKKGGSSK